MVYILVAVIALFLQACSHSSSEEEVLDCASKMMEEYPDSALRILREIPPSSLGTDGLRAKHSLLMSMALDKNYIDTADLAVISPAIEYYIREGIGTPDERLRTRFYEGRIYQNAGNDEMAMQSFISAIEENVFITDSLTLARALVAQGSLFYKQYKREAFLQNNLRAANIYKTYDRNKERFRALIRVLDSYICLKDKEDADSLLVECRKLAGKIPGGEAMMVSEEISYALQFGGDKELEEVIDKYGDMQSSPNIIMNLAYAKLKSGKSREAMDYLKSVGLSGFSSPDSLKYWALMSEIADSAGNYREALSAFHKYYEQIEKQHIEIFSGDLLFAEKKHLLEIDNLRERAAKNRLQIIAAAVICVLICGIAAIFYRMKLVGYRQRIAEKESSELKTVNDILRVEKESVSKKLDVSSALAKELQESVRNLEKEKEMLAGVIQEREEMDNRFRQAMLERLNILNGVLAKEISHNESYQKPYNDLISIIHGDKEKFMESIRTTYSEINPDFIEYLEKHDLSEREIHMVCLMALGLNGKEIGMYLSIKNHYNLFTRIRKKLELNSQDQNLASVIRKLVNRDIPLS